MAIELCIRKIDFKGAEHRSISPEVRAEGIQQRAVPVQEDDAGRENRLVHPSRLPYKAAKILMGLWRRRDEIVAIKIDVVKRSGKAAPARDAAVFRAHNVSGGFQAHASAAEGALDQGNLEFNGGPRRDIARSKKIDAAGTDIFCNQRHRGRLRASGNADQLQRQTQMGSRAAPPVFSDADRVGGHAQKRLVVQRRMDLANFPGRRVYECGGQLQFWKCPHCESPKSRRSQAETWNYALRAYNASTLSREKVP